MHTVDERLKPGYTPRHIASWHFRIEELSHCLETRWQRHEGRESLDCDVEALRGAWSDARVAFEHARELAALG